MVTVLLQLKTSGAWEEDRILIFGKPVCFERQSRKLKLGKIYSKEKKNEIALNQIRAKHF